MRADRKTTDIKVKIYKNESMPDAAFKVASGILIFCAGSKQKNAGFDLHFFCECIWVMMRSGL